MKALTSSIAVQMPDTTFDIRQCGNTELEDGDHDCRQSENPLLGSQLRILRKINMLRSLRTLVILAVLLSIPLARQSQATLPPEVRKELTGLQKELKTVSSLLRKQEVEKATEIVERAEARLKELEIPDGERDRSYTLFKTALQKAQYSLPVSFEAEVAEVLKSNCLRCHNEARSSGGFRLDSYAAIAKGGSNGPSVFAGAANRSPMALKLILPDEDRRMPKGAAKLKDEEILVIARWIDQGAPFDGEDPTAPIGDSLVEKKPPVKVTMADGSEKVSFSKDVAPWMSNLCINCHSGNNPRGGYAFATFEQLLSGGPTGNTIVPGKPDESYIVDLVLRQDPLKMPAGQAQLKLSQAKALETWVREGAKFDGTDPKAPIRSLVPTPEELEAARLAAMSDSDFADRRIQQAKDIWKRVAPRTEPNSLTTDNFHLYGTASPDRMQELADLAESHLSGLTGKYPLPGQEKPFRGRLILFVADERFDYQEFNTVLSNRRTPRSMSGHALVTAGFESAYVAMHDVGDQVSADSLDAPTLLRSLISQAYVGRSGGNLPDWLKHGFGLLESGLDNGSEYAKGITDRARAALATLTDPARLFSNGTFAPEEITDVGYLLVRFLLSQGGPRRLASFAAELRTTPNPQQALQKVYGRSAAEMAQAFAVSGL